MRKKKEYQFFSIHTITGTIFVLVVSFLLSFVAHTVDFFNPMEKAFKDFTLTDVVYRPVVNEKTGEVSNFKDRKVSDKIVLVNLGGYDPDSGRYKMAMQLNRINQFSPAVVGIDAFFKKPKEPYSDSILADAFRNTKNLVLVSKLDELDSTEENFSTLIRSADIFTKYAQTGFANFITGGEDGYLTTRRFSSHEKVGDKTEWCFTAQILSIYDKKKFEELKSRKRQTEVINYTGNLEKFARLDFDQVLDSTTDLSFLRGKIVLMGYLGETIGTPSLEDVFFTPLNAEMAGRSVPDMYGITVHANILSMMLGGYYISQAPSWFDSFLAILICMLNVSIFLYIGHKYRSTSQLMMRIVQIIQGVILTGLLIYLLAEKDMSVEFTVSLAILFLCADLTEIYEGSLHGFIERYRSKIGRPKVNARSRYYKKRRLFSK